MKIRQQGVWAVARGTGVPLVGTFTWQVAWFVADGMGLNGRNHLGRLAPFPSDGVRAMG